MIRGATIIEQPYSGKYRERIYDIESSWNSSEWTWVRFDDAGEVWCGEFRGVARGIALSEKCNKVFILTNDYLYVLSCINGEIMEYESQPQYTSMTVTPNGDVLVSDDYSIFIISHTLDEIEDIEMPFEADMIRFQGWIGNKMKISCYKFLEWGDEIELYSEWTWNEEMECYRITWLDN